MRRRIMVIGPDAGLRARLAQLLSGAGYRPEVAESVAHARRAGLEGIALAIVAWDGSDGSDAAIEAMTAEVGRVLVAASPGAKRPFPSDVADLSDEAGLLAKIAEALTSQPEADEAELIVQFAGYRLDLAGQSLADPVGKDIPLTRSEFGLLGRSSNARDACCRATSCCSSPPAETPSLTTAASTCSSCA